MVNLTGEVIAERACSGRFKSQLGKRHSIYIKIGSSWRLLVPFVELVKLVSRQFRQSNTHCILNFWRDQSGKNWMCYSYLKTQRLEYPVRSAEVFRWKEGLCDQILAQRVKLEHQPSLLFIRSHCVLICDWNLDLISGIKTNVQFQYRYRSWNFFFRFFFVPNFFLLLWWILVFCYEDKNSIKIFNI